MTRTILERAFELARSGAFTNVTDLKKALTAEGYNATQEIVGQSLIRSLLETCRAANGIERAPPKPKRKPLTAAERSEAARRGAARRFGRLSEDSSP
jgi:hypothetical protein